MNKILSITFLLLTFSITATASSEHFRFMVAANHIESTLIYNEKEIFQKQIANIETLKDCQNVMFVILDRYDFLIKTNDNASLIELQDTINSFILYSPKICETQDMIAGLVVKEIYNKIIKR